MADHSFVLKGWSVTVAAVLFALAAERDSPEIAALAVGPAVLFWLLDAYYLRQERLFRVLYNETRTSTRWADDPFSMSTKGIIEKRPVIWAPTVAGLHGTIVVAGVFLSVLLAY